MILKWVLNKWDVKVWIVFSWRAAVDRIISLLVTILTVDL